MKKTSTKILIVDDDPDIIEILTYNLSNEGYSVQSAFNGVEALEKAKKFIPDIILLDVMMPKMDGIDACFNLKKIESLSKSRIIFLSARGEDFTQIAAFDAGADDYINKPVKPKILLKKISSISRRMFSEKKNPSNIIFGSLVIDRESYIVTNKKDEISLPRKEFELLYLLASKPGKVLTRDEIMFNVWGTQVVVGDRTIDVHIRKLREKIGEKYIKTIKGVGYKFKV